jgi:hypothetical protein
MRVNQFLAIETGEGLESVGWSAVELSGTERDVEIISCFWSYLHSNWIQGFTYPGCAWVASWRAFFCCMVIYLSERLGDLQKERWGWS